jgi:hypothetical protein
MRNKGIRGLNEAPGYGVSEAGDVVNIKSGKTVTPSKGFVRLTVNKKRVTFRLTDLQRSCSVLNPVAKTVTEPEEEVAETPNEPKAGDEKVPEVKVVSRKVNEQDKELERRTVKEAGLTSGAALIYAEFNKNNAAFDVEEFSARTGIRMTRVKDGIRLCLLKLKKAKK